MKMFYLFAQFDVLESARFENRRKVYIGPDDEILYQIKSQSAGSKIGDVGGLSKVLFSPKKGAQLDDNEESADTHRLSRLWKKFIGILFNKCDRMNPLIVENARNVIDRKKDDLKEKLDIDTCIHRIERLESAILTLTKKFDIKMKIDH